MAILERAWGGKEHELAELQRKLIKLLGIYRLP